LNREILITGDGSPTLSIKGTGETYHSRHGALSESRHVFIEHGLKFVKRPDGKTLDVFELGFGTGLNAALTLLNPWNCTPLPRNSFYRMPKAIRRTFATRCCR
jgi:tRNA U34 5-methylaminomethyl-2-thiouridine-forming methyltransferase MnmC